MAGETARTDAICLAISPWSRTSHVVRWLTPNGPLATVVKGAVRPKSAFLGQYDLNYTCDIVYYAGSRGELHALRECAPVALREGLRGDFRALALADHFRSLAQTLAPSGPDGRDWFALLASALDGLLPGRDAAGSLLDRMIAFELGALRLAGLAPDFSGCAAPYSEFSVDTGSFSPSGVRKLRIASETAEYLLTGKAKNPTTPLDAARVIGVFYSFHLDIPPDIRRIVVKLISPTNGEGKQDG